MMQDLKLSAAFDLTSCENITTAIKEIGEVGYGFVCTPITYPDVNTNLCDLEKFENSFRKQAILLPSSEWSTLIVAKFPVGLDFDSEDEVIYSFSEKVAQSYLEYASFLSLPAILIDLSNGEYRCFGRFLNSYILSSFQEQLWIKLPLHYGDEQDGVEKDDSWTRWHELHTLCDYSKRVSLVLTLTEDLPDELVLQRWLGETVKAVSVPSRCFINNRAGYPVLSKPHQQFLKRLFTLGVKVIVEGLSDHKEKRAKLLYMYLDHLYNAQEPPDSVSQFARGYEDFLQDPLQPLMNNLESQTYEIFEKDPVKYKEYQLAIEAVLGDRVPEDKADEVVTVLMVLGAGRGPLVKAALSAAKYTNRKVRVYAVEKNRNAIVVLEDLKQREWGDTVTVVSSDMRKWNAPEKADIIVSELLGSFGDNELSPECLDGAQRFLKDDCVSIPSSYTSYIAPIHSTKIWNEVRCCRERDKYHEHSFETPYVVRMHNKFLISKPQALFLFEHPNKDFSSNKRFGRRSFDVECSCVLHGFAGFFEATLYKDICISIHPDTHSPGMFSWFPILFPIKSPLLLSKGDKIEVEFWRCVSEKKVWYEWALALPKPSSVHNPTGRSYFIGL